MLVIVENRNITGFFQSTLNFKAAGCGDVLQVYTAEAACKQFHCPNDFVYILGTHAKRERVHIAERLKQSAFAFHNGHARFRTDIAQTQNGSAVCNNCYKICPAGQFIALIHILLNFQTGLCNAGGVCEGKIVPGFQGSAADNFNFAFPLSMLFQGFFCVIHFFYTPLRIIYFNKALCAVIRT